MVLSNKQMGRLALPVLIEQALLFTVNTLNLAFVSRSSASAVSGVAMIDQVTLFTYCIFTVAGIGVSVVIAQLTGQGDTQGVRKALRHALLLGTCFALTVSAVGLLGNQPIVHLLLGQAEESVIHNASLYFILSACAYPFYMLYTVFIFALRGRGEMKATMFTTLMQSIVNVVLVYLFVSVLKLGVVGAGLAIILARVTGAACGLFFAVHAGLLESVRKFFPKKIESAMLKNIVRLGLPSGLEATVLTAVKIYIMTFVVHAGTAQMAALGPAQPAIDINTLLPLTLTYVVPTCMGFAKGSCDEKTLKRYGNRLLVLGFFLSLLSHGVTSLFAVPYANLFGLGPETTETIVRIMRMAAWAQGIPWAFAYVIPPIMRGAGDVVFTSLWSAIVMVAVRLPLSYYFCIVLQMGAFGIFAAMFADFAAKGVINLLYFLTGRWTRKQKVTAG